MLCLLNGTETTMVPSSRLEKILIALVNGEDAPTTFESELEKALVETFGESVKAEMEGNILYISAASAIQTGETVTIL